MKSRLGALLEISTKLRRLRVAKGMSTRELASAAGLSQSRVSRIENARTAPKELDVLAIGDALQLSPALIKSFLSTAAFLNEVKPRAKTRQSISCAVVNEVDNSARYIKCLHGAHVPRTVQTVPYMQATYRSQRTMHQTEWQFVTDRIAMQARELTTPAERQMLLSLDALFMPNVDTRSWLEMLYGFGSRLSFGNYELGIVSPTDLNADERCSTISVFDTDLVLTEQQDHFDHSLDKSLARTAAHRFDELASVAEWDGTVVKYIDEAINYFEHKLGVR